MNISLEPTAVNTVDIRHFQEVSNFEGALQVICGEMSIHKKLIWILKRAGVALQQLVPTSPLKSYVDKKTNVTVDWNGLSYKVNDPRKSDSHERTIEDADDLAKNLPRGSRVKLLIAEKALFFHGVAIPHAAKADYKRILDNELNALLPFTECDLLKFQWLAQSTSASVLACTAVVKREDVRKIESALVGTSSKLVAIGIREPETQQELPTYLDKSGQGFASQTEWRWANAAVLSALSAVVVSILVWNNIQARASLVINKLGLAEAQIERDAIIVRQEIDANERNTEIENEIVGLADQHVPNTRIMHELVGSLPDDAWLQGLSRKQNEIFIEGFSQKPETLIERLEKSRLFEGVTFVSPVVQAPGALRQRFNIKLMLQIRGP